MKKKNKRNAVLYKEMTVDMKKPKLLIIMLLVNIALMPILAGFALYIGIAGFSGMLGYRALANFFIAVIYTEAAILLFVTPAITAGSVSLEKERQTLDVLLTTRMTPYEIIKGKYFSNYLLLAMMIFSTIPVLSLVFIYGGVAFFQLFYVFVALAVYVALITSFGVFFSTLTKNTVLSVILTYLFTFFYFIITAALPVVLVGGIEILNQILYEDYNVFYFITERHLINGDYFILTGILNPFYMIFDVIGHSVGYVAGESGIEGINSIGDILAHTSSKNILFRLWTPLSMIVQLLITFVILKISGAMLNPVHYKRKKKRK